MMKRDRHSLRFESNTTGSKNPSERIPSSGQESALPAKFYGKKFTVSVPEGWENETIYRLEGPSTNGTTPRIEVIVDPDAGDVTAMDYAEVQIKVQKQSVNGRRLIEEKNLRLKNSLPAYWVQFSWTANEGGGLIQDHLYVVSDQIGYRLTVTQEQASRPLKQVEVEQMFVSFTPTHPLRIRRKRSLQR